MTDLRPTADTSALLVIDIQERLLPAIDPAAADRVVQNARLLVEAAHLFGVPVIASEQYPRGLGPTIAPIANALGGAAPLPKVEFSAVRNPELAAAIAATGRRHIVVCGIETHVCVLQTALDLVADGKVVHVASDAVGSRDPANRLVGLEIMRQAGAVVSSAETVAFQWAGRAGSEAFKALSRLVR